MNRQGLQKIGRLFRELGSISESLSVCEADRAEAMILPDGSLPLMEYMQHGVRGEEKPIIRTIHHFACTGGTLISKCLSALPNVFLLSEVHPFSELEINTEKPKFTPSNLSKLARYASIPMIDKLADKIFVDSIKSIHRHLESVGGQLILRDHSHSDYCIGSSVAQKPKVSSILEEDFEIYSVATIRDPIDSYMSLVRNGWVKFEPDSLDEYCRRMLIFLSEFSEEKIFRYEDFLGQPQKIMKEMCAILSVGYCERFSEIFDIFKLTGDSGRSGVDISKRNRLEIGGDLIGKAISSKFYNIVCEKFNYSKIYD